jgi:hypothetical protein
MRILIEGRSLKRYLAKCHEAFRTGLVRTFGARCYGPGYPRHRPRFLVPDFPSMAAHVFADGARPDLVIAQSNYHLEHPRFDYAGLKELGCETACMIGDHWSIDGERRERFCRLIAENRVSHVIAMFPGAQRQFAGTAVEALVRWWPPCVDPEIFNDWRLEKRWDVGFLAAGTAVPDLRTYPERDAIHRQLLAQRDLRYLWAAHPGWRRRILPHPLVGANFSRAINRCRIFVTTCGIHRHPQPKIVEALASRTLLMSDEPEGAAELGLVDGATYVRISAGDAVEKIRHYLARPQEAEAIAEAGYRLAIERHTCYARAIGFRQMLASRRPSP